MRAYDLSNPAHEVLANLLEAISSSNGEVVHDNRPLASFCDRTTDAHRLTMALLTAPEMALAVIDSYRQVTSMGCRGYELATFDDFPAGFHHPMREPGVFMVKERHVGQPLFYQEHPHIAWAYLPDTDQIITVNEPGKNDGPRINPFDLP